MVLFVCFFCVFFVFFLGGGGGGGGGGLVNTSSYLKHWDNYFMLLYNFKNSYVMCHTNLLYFLAFKINLMELGKFIHFNIKIKTKYLSNYDGDYYSFAFASVKGHQYNLDI